MFLSLTVRTVLTFVHYHLDQLIQWFSRPLMHLGRLNRKQHEVTALCARTRRDN